MVRVIERIIKLRKLKGISQKQMAEQLGIAVINYGKYERGETSLTISRLNQISKILDVDPVFFYYDNDKYSVETGGDINEDFSIKLIHKEKDAEIGLLNLELSEKKIYIKRLLIKLSYNVINKNFFELNAIALFYYYLYCNYNGLLIDTECYKWFNSFISLYNIDRLKELFPDFFSLLNEQFKDIGERNNDEDGSIDFQALKLEFYVMKNAEKKDFVLHKIKIEWFEFYEQRLLLESLNIYSVYTFFSNNELVFKTLLPNYLFKTWLEFKKTKEQG